MKKYKSYIIPLIVIGIPFFVDFYLTLFFPEGEWKFCVSPVARKCVRLLELFAVFLSLYVAYLYNIFFRKILLLVWVILIYIPAALDWAC
ncbi:MAG: hypothetical protein IJ730_04665, partial [Alphaproteobacteria bacterium]|nr:hypothetical protein [Alphaproteobacteria bacterium]